MSASALFAFAAAALALPRPAAALSLRPHIVVIVVDDMGWNDVGFHGSTQIPTPNLDALAFNGVILNRHYVMPTCTPSRSALMTGRYPIHTGMQGGPTYAAEPNGLPLEFKILPEYLKDIGYKTHAVGKWHLGYFRKPYTPLSRGFDSFLGCYTGYVGYYDFISQAKVGEEEYLNGYDMRRNETTAWDLAGRYVTDLFSTEARMRIEAHDPSDPLFLYLAHTAPHGSHLGMRVEAPRERINRMKHILDPNRRTYAAMVSKIDDSVGEVVEALKEKGMINNTIILFMSDNGAPTISSYYPNWGSNFPLRGAKETLWEGGVRSASFIWSPQLQQRPRVSHQLIHLTDWVPTLYAAAGGDAYDLPLNLDGVNQWSSLLWNLPSRRNSILLNINEKEKSAALIAQVQDVTGRSRKWKIMLGETAGGKYDEVYNDVRSPKNPLLNLKEIVKSQAYSAVASLTRPPPAKEEAMQRLREEASVVCPDNQVAAQVRPHCARTPCIFDLDNDPCERFNLIGNSTYIAERLYNVLKSFRETLLPQSNKPIDPDQANPARFNNTWSPWVY